jgi:glucose-1-phosphate thymidylyltransferase
MKGIILAAGTGSRLFPITHSSSKALLPVYNKPMVYYPLSALMLSGITEILIICSKEFLPLYRNLLGDGSKFGISIRYEIQHAPDGIAQSFQIGEEFIGDDCVCLVLGDNLFYGHGLPELLSSARKKVESEGGGVVFGYNVKEPEKYGVAEIINEKLVGIEEKPDCPKSNWAVIGIYMYDNSVVEVANSIGRSVRGELEITSVNQEFLKKEALSITTMGRGYTWFDTGNAEDLFSASSFVRMIENRQGLNIACLEEIAYYMGYINSDELLAQADILSGTAYGKYIKKVAEYESNTKEGIFIYEQK